MAISKWVLRGRQEIPYILSHYHFQQYAFNENKFYFFMMWKLRYFLNDEFESMADHL